MNIFLLDSNLQKSAEMLCDIHLNKQILELAQILSTIVYMNGQKVIYKPTHVNHPVTKWSKDYIGELVQYSYFLHSEYVYRFRKGHKAHRRIRELKLNLKYIREWQVNDFPIKNDLSYYKEKLANWLVRKDKPVIIAKWTRRPIPEWYTKIVEKYENSSGK